jgi:hypothetical protein
MVEAGAKCENEIALEATLESTVKGLMAFLSLPVNLPCFVLKLMNLLCSVSSCFSRLSGLFSYPSRAYSEGVRPVDSMYLSRASSHRSSKPCLVDMYGSRVRGMNSYVIECID